MILRKHHFPRLFAYCYTQYDMFSSAQEQEREAKLQTAMLKIRDKYGKNSLIKCTSLQEGATMMERNRQIGGHRA